MSKRRLKLIYFFLFILLFYVTNGPFSSLKGGWVTFFQSRGQNGPKIQFCRWRRGSIFINERRPNFYHLLCDPKPLLGAFPGNLERVFFFRKIHFCIHPFQRKKAILAFGGSLFGQKTWKIKWFQFIQSKISQFVTKMWLRIFFISIFGPIPL